MSGLPSEPQSEPATAALPGEVDAESLPRMGFWEHLDELRRRLQRAVLAFIVAFLVCWAFSRPIFNFLAIPVYNALPEGEKLVFLKVTDPFIVYVKVAALVGVFLASPMILAQAWGFIAPGLYRKEKRAGVIFILFGSLLFLAGGLFGYFVAFPYAVQYLLSVGEGFEASLTINDYLNLLITVLLGLGIMFELPTVILILARLGLVTPRFLLRHSRIAIVLIFMVSAIVTPTPDVVNLCAVAVPTVALYFLGILVAWIVTPRKSED